MFNNVEMNSLSNYKNINLKLLFPILLGIKYQQDLLTIDDNFFDNLTIKYDQPENISFGLIESDKIIDETRLTQNDKKENILYQDLALEKQQYYDLDKKINNYQIEGKNIFNYQIYLMIWQKIIPFFIKQIFEW